MSTGSSPTLGFDDDSGQRPWDDDSLLFNNTAQVTGTIQSAVVDCSRFASLYAQCRPVGAQGTMSFNWYVDQAQTIALRADAFSVDPNIANTLAVNVPNGGPWLQVTCSPNGGGGVVWTPLVQCMLNNRLSNLWSLSIKSHLSRDTNILAAGASVTTFPIGYFNGRTRVAVEAGVTDVSVEIDFLTTFFGWFPFFFETVPANTIQCFETIWPINATRTIRTNLSSTIANNSGLLMVIPEYNS